MNNNVEAVVEEGKPETVGVSGDGEGKPETVGVGIKTKKRARGPEARTCMWTQDITNPKTGESLISLASVKNVCTGDHGKPLYASIELWAYILHNQDTYRQEDIDAFNERERAKQAEDPSYAIEPCSHVVGDKKADHIHGMISRYPLSYRSGDKVSPVPLASVAEWFGIPVNAIDKTQKGGLDGVALALAYMVHDPRLGDAVAGKHVYDWSEVATNIKNPKKLVDDYFAKRSTKDRRAAIYHVLRSVTLGKMTYQDAKREMCSWGEDGSWELWKKKISDARADFLSSCPVPPLRINFYIGGNPGTGKTFLGGVLANLIAKQLYPDILTDDERAYTVNGDAGISFEGYDGQPVIIWDDCRGNAITAILKGRGNVFRAFDSHPKKMDVNKKFAFRSLVNTVNIVTASQSFESFLRQISGVNEYMEYGDEADMDQIKQAERRFPIWINVDENYLEAYYRSGYMGEEFKRVVKILSWRQNIEKLARAEMPYSEKEKVIARGCAPLIGGEHGIITMIDAQKKAQDGEHYEYQTAEEYWEKNNVPDPVIPCEIVNDVSNSVAVITPVQRLPLEVSAVYGKHPDAWVEEHPNAEDDKQLVDADFHVVRKYREGLKPREGNYYDFQNERMRNSAGNVNGNAVDAEQDRTKVTPFSA